MWPISSDWTHADVRLDRLCNSAVLAPEVTVLLEDIRGSSDRPHPGESAHVEMETNEIRRLPRRLVKSWTTGLNFTQVLTMVARTSLAQTTSGPMASA